MVIISVIAIAIVTFVTRIVNLLAVPIFTDEAIYIRWAQIGLADPAHRYISLTDGKQPLLTWLMYPLLLIFDDPLVAGRLVSVISGTLAAVGIYLVTQELFDKKAALFASIIYIISPFTIVYDRLALMDSLLAMFSIFILYLEVLLIKKVKLDIALLLGATLGLAYLTKSSALFFILLIPTSLLLFNFKNKNKKALLSRWVFFCGISIFIAQIIYNSLRLSPYFYIIDQKDHSFILSFAEFFSNPFALFIPNLYGLTAIFITYLTIPFSIVIIISLFWAILTKNRKIILLFLWFFVPFLTLAAFGKVIFPRFILFMIMPLFVVIAYFLSEFSSFAFKKMKYFLVLIALIFLIPAYQSLLLIISPVDSAIPSADRNQLFDDWPSGYGVGEVINFLEDRAQISPIVVGTEGTFGLNPAVYEIYLGDNENVKTLGFWPVNEVPKELLEHAKNYPTYLIFKEKQIIPDEWPLKLIAKYPRGRGKTFLLFYQVDLSKYKNG